MCVISVLEQLLGAVVYAGSMARVQSLASLCWTVTLSDERPCSAGQFSNFLHLLSFLSLFISDANVSNIKTN